MVVIIYCYIGCEDEVITWYYSTHLIEVVNTCDLGVVSHIQRIGCQSEKNVYLTLTDPLRIQPWSQDRRNQTKSNRKRSEISRESRQKRMDKKVASKGHRRDRQKNPENTNKIRNKLEATA